MESVDIQEAEHHACDCNSNDEPNKYVKQIKGRTNQQVCYLSIRETLIRGGRFPQVQAVKHMDVAALDPRERVKDIQQSTFQHPPMLEIEDRIVIRS